MPNGLTLAPAVYDAMRGWLSDIETVETEHMTGAERVAFFAEASNAAILRAMYRLYDGTVADFIRAEGL